MAVIIRALDDLPAEIPADVLQQAEKSLVAHCADLDPKGLHRLGTRIIELVAPEIAEEAEAKKLAALEAQARRATKLSLRRLGDGTTRIGGILPDHAAARLATYLEAFTNPRKHPTGPNLDDQSEAFAKLPYPRRLGEAFCQLLETVDPTRLPLHGGDATTVIVTIPLTDLRSELAASTLHASQTPGDEVAGDRLSAGEIRRLACTAKIIPAVLGGDSEPLDLGRARRLHTPAMRKALLIRDKVCRAVACDIPGTWAEAHHWVPWSRGGHTNLADGVLLCSHHHHRAHDPDYESDRLPNGDVRFTRRT